MSVYVCPWCHVHRRTQTIQDERSDDDIPASTDDNSKTASSHLGWDSPLDQQSRNLLMRCFCITLSLFQVFLLLKVSSVDHHDRTTSSSSNNTNDDDDNISIEQDDDDYEAPEPYHQLHNFCSECNPHVPQSPDPFVSTTWNYDCDDTKLQYYRVHPPPWTNIIATPKDAITRSNNSGKLSFTIHKNCSILIDWGVERAAWMELLSPVRNLSSSSSSSSIHASISEFRMPYPGKTKPLVRYGGNYSFTYRLETNKELYEGIRFTWLFVKIVDDNDDDDDDDDDGVIQIDDISLVAKVKPINYTGSFLSSNEELTRAWYTGAYGVRLNMEENEFNSVLVERGDRVAIQGDGHPTIDAALVAFSPYKLVQNVLNQTDSGNHHVVDEGIMAYPLYWCLSAISYVMESGDANSFVARLLARDIMKILDARISDFLEPDLDIQWFGWDDRLGNGWCFHKNGDRCPKEAHLALAGLVLRVCRDFARLLILHNPVASQKYKHAYHELGRKLVATPEWPQGFGVHAAANAINSGIANQTEIDLWMHTVLNDATTVCSVSQFNQYWILQAFGNANRMEHAIASIKLCWGTPLKLGKGCFWENSSPDWLSFMKEGDAAPGLPSYCHPWASGVTAWLSHVLGGIQPLLPGYQQFLAAPYVSRKHPAVSASIATPAGKISVNATLQEDNDELGSTFQAVLKSPVPGYFGLYKHLTSSNGGQDGALQSVSVNKTNARFLTHLELCDTIGIDPSLSIPSDALVYVDLSGGAFDISAKYSGKEEAEPNEVTSYRFSPDLGPFPEPQYPAFVSGLDSDSRGDGLAIHGKDGYLLVGYNNNGSDVVNLPDYIENVTIWKHGFPGWIEEEREFIGTSLNDKTYLPLENSPVRKLGMVGYDNSRGGQINNLFLHIAAAKQQLTTSPSFYLSVYFVAANTSSIGGNKHSIRVMDLESLNVIAPDAFIHNYTKGVWWTIKYDRSIRLRMSNVKGIRVSAVAFTKEENVAID